MKLFVYYNSSNGGIATNALNLSIFKIVSYFEFHILILYEGVGIRIIPFGEGAETVAEWC